MERDWRCQNSKSTGGKMAVEALIGERKKWGEKENGTTTFFQKSKNLLIVFLSSEQGSFFI